MRNPKLNVTNNPNVTDVSWMTTLQKLDAEGNSGIKNLKLKYLNSINNRKINYKNG